MRLALIRGVIIGLLMAGAGCGRKDVTSPISTPKPGIPAEVPVFPPVEGPARIFDFGYWLVKPTGGDNSRFVLYDDGTFALQVPGFAYRGKYFESNGAIKFEWPSLNSAGPWDALGALRGDTLTVQYNIVMLLSDFEDAVYILKK